MKQKRFVLNYFPIFLILLLFTFSFQNCGKINVDPIKFSSQSTVGMELDMKPPTTQKWNRRYVFFIDMSYSMVSGPCPFDVDVSNSIHGFDQSYTDFDPNFPEDSNFNDSRYRVSDCSVDTSLPFGSMTLDYKNPANPVGLPNHKTYKGSDFAGNRFAVLNTWIGQMRNSHNPEFLERTQILIIPTASGAAFNRLLINYPLKNLAFLSLIDPKLDEGLIYLKNIHDTQKLAVITPPDQRFLDDPNLDKNKMGTSSYQYAMTNSFPLIDKEMEKLALSGELTQTSFKIIAFADQRVNPVQEQFTKALEPAVFSDCALCQTELQEAWGTSNYSNLVDADLKLSLIQGLTKYYGAGLVETEFLHLTNNSPIDPIVFKSVDTLTQQSRTGDEFPKNQINVIDYLHSKSIERNVSSQIILLPNATAPYRIANVNTGVTTFKITNVFLLNMNYKLDNNGNPHIDTDGDGVPDDLEILRGLDPMNPRSNGYCLDSINIEPTLKRRCEALAQARLCDPKLDSDGDGLNECDEMTIGTDPYDFDTDGDGIPDILEVLNGSNPLVDDNKTDSNSDGLSDMINFTMGLSPLQKPQYINPLNLIKISLKFLAPNFVNDANIGRVRVDRLDLGIDNFPMIKTMAAVPRILVPDNYYLRSGARGFNPSTSKVNSRQSLIRPILKPNTNNLVALLRIIDPDEPQKVYWEILDSEVSVLQAQTNLGKINISDFFQMKVVDRVRVDK